MQLSDWLECPHLKAASARVPGLSFRGFKGEADIDRMSEVSHLGWKADGVEWLITREETSARLEDASDHDRKLDLLFAEVDGEVIGYSDLAWDSSDVDPKYYGHVVHLLPQWRGKGVAEAMFLSNEARLREISGLHPASGRSYIRLWAFDGPSEWRRIVESSGYSPTWHLLEMVHNDLASVHDRQPPEGLDFEPARPTEYASIWALFRECFAREQWTSPEKWSDEAYEEWIRSPNFMPDLWMVARSGDQIVGIVESYANKAEWEAFGRNVAHGNRVCVRQDWRRKGVCTYLLSRSLKLLRDIGADEVTLDTEVENRSMAMKVYQKVGFSTRRTFTFYAKLL